MMDPSKPEVALATVREAQSAQASEECTDKELEQVAGGTGFPSLESLRLQMVAERRSKVISTLQEVLKKSSDTSQAITKNMK